MEENKPLIVIVDELREKVFSAVNECGLSPTIINMVFKEINSDIKCQCDSYDKQQRDEYKSKKSGVNNTVVSEPTVSTK